MKKIAALGALGLLAACSMGQTATPTPFQVKFGWNYLIDDESRDLTDDSGFHVGLGYRLPSRGLVNPLFGFGTLELEYLRVGSSDNHLDTISLAYIDRFPFSNESVNQKTMPYGGIGIGAFFHSLRLDDGLLNVEEDKTNVGGILILGLRFQNDYFAEVGYRFTGSVEGFKTDALTVSVGVRF